MSLTDDTVNAANLADPTAAFRAYRGGVTTPLNADTVTVLQSMRAYPSISLLANTTPGQLLDRADSTRLLTLAAEADARLRDEAIDDRGPLLDMLSDMISRAVYEPSDRAVAFFVSRSHQCRVSLPFLLSIGA